MDNDLNLEVEIDVTHFNISPTQLDKNSFANVIYLNARSLRNKLETFQNFLDSLTYKVDIIVVTESWLCQEDIPYFNFVSYNSFHSTRKNNIGGGVAIFIHQSFDSASIIFEQDFCNNNALIVNLLNHKMKIMAVYRQPNNENDISGAHFLNTFESIISKHDHMFIIGDLNINLFNKSNLTTNYINTYSLNGYSLLNSDSLLYPTRINKKKGTTSCIDHILSDMHFSRYNFYYNLFLFDFPNLDHKMMVLNINTKNTSLRKPKIKSNLVKLTNHNKISSLKLIEKCEANNFEQYLNSIREIIHNNSYSIKIAASRKPYITPEIISFIQIRNNFFKLKTKFPFSVYFSVSYKSYRNKVINTIKKEKRKYIDSYFENNLNDPKKTWNQLRTLLYNKECKIKNSCELLIENGISITNQKYIANRFNSFFINVTNNINNNAIISDEDRASYFSNEVYDIIHPFKSPSVSEDEILLIINNLSNSKAVDYYDMSNFFVKTHKSQITPILTRLINDSLSKGIFENALKIGVVSPIHKLGSKTDKSNYRPITVLPILSKIFEYVILRRLEDHFELNKLVNRNQYGYVKKANTEIAMIHVLKDIYEGIDETRATALTCLDLSKAFDSVDHNILLGKLKKTQLSSTFYNLLKSYFHERKQLVRIESAFSDCENIVRGTPQGGVLSGFIFNLYLYSISKLKLNSQISLYADDISMVTHALNPTTLKSFIESDLQEIATWLKYHSLIPNEKKTKYILFHNRKNHENFTIQTLNITLNGQVLERVESMRVLGLELDERLSFNNHILQITKKIVPFIYALKRIRKYLTEKTALSMYYAYVDSKISYMSALWSTAPKYLLDSIDILQRKALRIVYRKEPRCSKKEIYNEQIIPASLAGEVHTIILLFKMINNLAVNNHELTKLNQIHAHVTRNASNFYIPLTNTQFGSNNFYIRALKLFNNLPNEIKKIRSLAMFKHRLKECKYDSIDNM